MVVLVHRAGKPEFDKLPQDVWSRVVQALEAFDETGRGDIRHVDGDLWALRAGSYRIYIGWGKGVTRAVGVDHRKVAYTKHRIEALEKRLTGR